MTSNNIVTSILAGTDADAAAAIPDGGRRIAYRGYLIHGEIPGICYVIYGRNARGWLAELGTVSDFPAAMRWVDRHLAELRRILPVHDSPMPGAISDTAALRQAA